MRKICDQRNKMIKIFICGRCKKDIGTREALRKHLREEHLIKREKANVERNGRLVNQSWWKWRESK